ncbi:hypothetical protein ACFPRL_08615 [Pseudoclavibacter helvolus]
MRGGDARSCAQHAYQLPHPQPCLRKPQTGRASNLRDDPADGCAMLAVRVRLITQVGRRAGYNRFCQPPSGARGVKPSASLTRSMCVFSSAFQVKTPVHSG